MSHASKLIDYLQSLNLKLFGTLVLLFSFYLSQAQVVIMEEDFEDATVNYMTDTPEFHDGTSDYFFRTGTNPANPTNATPNPVNPYTVFSGEFFAVEDMDDGGAKPPSGTLTFDIDITGYTDLTLDLLFAAGGNLDPTPAYDKNDGFLITAQIDGGTIQNLLSFEAETIPTDSTNKITKQDTDFDGVGDGFQPTSAATAFNGLAIAGIGTNLKIYIFITSNDGDVEYAFDDVTVSGTSSLTQLLCPTDQIVGGQIVGSNFEEGMEGCCDSPVNQWPGGEPPSAAIDGFGQKHLNFGQTNTGFIITPTIGSSIAEGLKLWTANDAEDRDPASYEIYGTNSTITTPLTSIAMSSFTSISSGALTLPSSRNAGGQAEPLLESNSFEVLFANTDAYSSYLVVFPTVKNATSANSMQVAEVQILGTCAGGCSLVANNSNICESGSVSFTAQCFKSPTIFHDVNSDGEYNSGDIDLGMTSPLTVDWTQGAGDFQICVFDAASDKICDDISCTSLNVNGVFPTIDTDVVNYTACEGGRAVFQVQATASNGGALSYQWFSAPSTGGTFTIMPGETNSFFNLTNVSLAMDQMVFRVEITEAGSVCEALASNIGILIVSSNEASAPGFWEIPAGTQTFDLQGDPSNTVLYIGSSPATNGARLIGIGWDVSITPIGSSWYSESAIAFGPVGGASVINLTPGVADANAGAGVTQDYASDGIIDLVSLGLDFEVSDGIVELEFYEDFDDVADAADADISGTLYFEFDLCGESLCTNETLTYDGTDPSIDDQTKERVNDKIIVTATIGNVQVPNPNDVDLRAGNYISIEKNFETLLGAKLLLDIESCVKLEEQVPSTFLSNEDVKKKAKVEKQVRQFKKGDQVNRGVISRASPISKKE